MRAFIHRPQSVLLRRVLFQVHLWIGVLASTYVLLVCLTGAALVFRIDMQRATFPALFTPTPGTTAEPAVILDAVAAAYPSGRLSGIDAPTTARPTYLAYVTVDGGFRTVLVDPVTARVLGELPDDSWVRTLQDLHFDLLGGRTGRVVNGVGGALLALLAMTGLVVWWPGLARWTRALTIDWRRGWRRINWDMHSAIGIWTAALVLMWAVTGIYFAFPAQFRATVNAFSSLTVVKAPTSADAAGRSPRPWREQLDAARRHAPASSHVARVVLPWNPRGAFQVLFAQQVPTPVGATLPSVYLDQYSGQVLAAAAVRRSTGDVIMAWVGPLHVGSFGGAAVKWAWLILGLAPVVLSITGVVMWWTRVVQPWRRRRGNASDGVSRVA